MCPAFFYGASLDGRSHYLCQRFGQGRPPVDQGAGFVFAARVAAPVECLREPKGTPTQRPSGRASADPR
jgi:hypothetical protein